MKINQKMIQKYREYLYQEEKSRATIEKYMRDIEKFYNELPSSKTIKKETVIAYKTKLIESYKTTSANSMLVAVNSFLSFVHLDRCQVKLYKIQKKVFSDNQKELTKQEYRQLLEVAGKRENQQLYVLIQTICTTGIRVSEHRFITVEAIKEGKAIVNNKGKIREILFPKKLRVLLMGYCRRNDIRKGIIFMTKTKKALDRSNIWKMMKLLCEEAQVSSEKVFPHNLRHLFAVTYYRAKKDIVKLAGILGHSSIETTRIYTMTNTKECIRSMTGLGLLLEE